MPGPASTPIGKTDPMAPPITRVTAWMQDDYSCIIDVRAPAEFADDHVPGAINLPVLNDAERAEIGTLHKQIGPFEAKRRGAALVARNIARHLETELCNAPRDFRPLVYCWRGGQRSGAMARILSEIGWKTTVIEGGYKHYRKQVLEQLDSIPQQLNLVILRGATGTAKTRILHAAESKGAQVIDLEGLAHHRGSLLGPEPGIDQPSQRQFESGLAAVLARFDPAQPVFIEAESNKIGAIHIPKILWLAMKDAPSVSLSAPVAARVGFLLRDYAHVIAEPERLEPLLDWVVARIGHEAVTQWRALIASGDWNGFVSRVLEDHYDPAYRRSSARRGHHDLATLEAPDLTPDTIDQMASKLLASVSGE